MVETITLLALLVTLPLIYVLFFKPKKNDAPKTKSQQAALDAARQAMYEQARQQEAASLLQKKELLATAQPADYFFAHWQLKIEVITSHAEPYSLVVATPVFKHENFEERHIYENVFRYFYSVQLQGKAFNRQYWGWSPYISLLENSQTKYSIQSPVLDQSPDVQVQLLYNTVGIIPKGEAICTLTFDLLVNEGTPSQEYPSAPSPAHAPVQHWLSNTVELDNLHQNQCFTVDLPIAAPFDIAAICQIDESSTHLLEDFLESSSTDEQALFHQCKQTIQEHLYQPKGVSEIVALNQWQKSLLAQLPDCWQQTHVIDKNNETIYEPVQGWVFHFNVLDGEGDYPVTSIFCYDLTNQTNYLYQASPHYYPLTGCVVLPFKKDTFLIAETSCKYIYLFKPKEHSLQMIDDT
jgi:hypothetical protein